MRKLLPLFLVAGLACGGEGEPPDSSVTPRPDLPAGESRQTAIRFEDATEAAGIHFHHQNGARGEKYMPETLGSGVCIFDFDGDGWEDLYFVQSGPLGDATAQAGRPGNSLYENREGKSFHEVSGEAGVSDSGYGMGCSVGDIDNDGDPDLFVTNFGPDRLYRNEGNGTFTDITEVAGVGNEGWSASAAFADYDGDGLLDLYVARYVDFTLSHHIYCGEDKPGYQTYCHPQNYDGLADSLYKNLGGGRFKDVALEAGVQNSGGKGLGVVWTDFDGDGSQDIYVANDATPNFLYLNRGDGTFVDVAGRAGVALSEEGLPQAGMGVAVADCDGDGREDIFVTNLAEEANALYRNEGKMLFTDETFLSGLGSTSLLPLGFGASFLDADADGDPDLLVANGHILDNVALFSDTITFEQAPLFYENRGGCRFEEISSSVGRYFREKDVGRGTAVGDLDRDGDPDLVINSNNRPAHYLRNQTRVPGNHWISLALVGRFGRPPLGAWVEVVGERRWGKRLHGASSYLSQDEMALHFGLGRAEEAREVVVHWPQGARQRFGPLMADRFYLLREGETQVLSGEPGTPRPR